MYKSTVVNNLSEGIYTCDILQKGILFETESQTELFDLTQDKFKLAFPNVKAEDNAMIELSNVCRQKYPYHSTGCEDRVHDYSIGKHTLLLFIKPIFNKCRHIFLIQSAECNTIKFVEMISDSIKKSKTSFSNLDFILCRGNMASEQYKRLYDAGSGIYIHIFQTSNEDVLNYCKPNDTFENRMYCLEMLLEIDHKVRSGNTEDFPGQTIDDIVDHPLFLQKYLLAVNSSLVFISAENFEIKYKPVGDIKITLKTMDLLRIMNPRRCVSSTILMSGVERVGR